MRLAIGTRLGNFEIVSGIGAGAMGEVYRAHDTVLRRDVAIKIVHPELYEHPDSLARLRREARALAALNHPHIAAIYGVEEAAGIRGLVLELVNGPTLADLLAARRLPLNVALQTASQVAEALEAAHERGILHRDLKPANIKIATEGGVKVLDFGLAKDVAAMVVGTASETSTRASVATAEGTLLGTPAYMSPEQARGMAVDKRSDIWAFGCVLFEMLSGRLPFQGGSPLDTLAAIVEREPNWTVLPDDLPAGVRRLLTRCLQKDVRRRLRDIGDARLDLEEASRAEHPIAGPVATLTRFSHVGRALALLAAGAAVGALAVAMSRPARLSQAASEVRFSIALPDDERVAATTLGALALSPDSRTIVYVAPWGSTTQLLRRSVDTGTVSAIQGTAGATTPFFSPDGEWIAFFADDLLKKIPVRGGTPVPVCNAPDGLGGTWNPTGTIVFASATGAGLQQVSANGGSPVRATTLDVSRGEFSHRWPQFLPDGDTLLFTVGSVGEWDDAEIVAQTMSSGRRTLILKGGTYPRYLASGHLAYAHDQAIWVSAFDVSRLTLSGSPTRVLDQVTTSVDGAAQFSVSPSGSVVYQPSAPLSAKRLIVVDSSGPTPLAAAPHAYVSPRVAPNGRSVLLGVGGKEEHVWSYDLTEGTLRQLTFEASNRSPIWSADGQRVTFASNRLGAMNLFTVPMAGDGPAERLTTTDSLQLPGSWSPDGELLAFVEQDPSTGRDIWLLRRNGERTAWAKSEADESAPRFSHDGTRIAYVSNASGQPEVYVRAVNGSGPARRVSISGGSEPVWRRDADALYFRSYGKVFEVATSGAPRMVFDGAAEPGTFDAAGYDVIGNTGRLLMIASSSSNVLSELRVILNWRSVTPSSPSPSTAAR